MPYNCRVKVIMHGYLRDICPDVEMSGYNVKEIINGVCKQTKAFDVVANQERHCITVEGFQTQDALYSPIPPDTKELHFFPALGGGKGGFFQVIIGAVIIAAVIYTGGVAGGFAIGATGITTSSILMNIGISLVLGGLLSLLSPAPKMDGNGNVQDPEGSKYLAANGNTTKIGTRIPLMYGRNKAYGQYLSFDIDAVDVAL